MDMTKFREPFSSDFRSSSVEEWSERLRSVCGNFRPQTCEGIQTVVGKVQLIEVAGIEFVQVANDLASVSRNDQDIKADYGKNVFLLIQLDGACEVEQHGRYAALAPGDCILVDSSTPSVFRFGGRFSNHISVHLPRQILLSRAGMKIDMAIPLRANDPMSDMLRALVSKMCLMRRGDPRSADMRELLFQAVRQAFAAHVPEADLHGDTVTQRMEIVQLLIDRHLTDERLTARWLADRVGVSLRTLQNDFSRAGMTFNSLIRTKRLHYAREALVSRGSDRDLTIAEVAYEAGFNDISYFNRCFKKAFDCVPTDLLHQRAAERT